jgi:CheY-like chemotaxis protein
MSKTVMIVDDSGSFRTVVKLALQKAGYEVVEAVDGKDACGKLNGDKINLIVCDVNMPNMDGLSFLRHLKTTRQLQVHAGDHADHRVAGGQEGRGQGRRRPRLDHQALPALAAGGRRQQALRVRPAGWP